MKPFTYRSRAKQSRKGSGYTFLRLPHYMTKSREWAQLGKGEVKLLVEIAHQYNGHNNGDLSIPFSKMRHRGFASSDTLNKLKKKLLASGFIVLTRQGGLHVCSLFAITWEPIDECGGKLDVSAERVASNAWKKSSTQFVNRINSPAVSSESEPVAKRNRSN